MLTAMTLLVLGGWIGSELELHDECVAVTNVWAKGPAAASGLVDDDCLQQLTLNGGSIQIHQAEERLRSAKKGSVLKAKTTTGKSITLKLGELTKETEREFCEWLQPRRIKVEVLVASGCKPKGGGTLVYAVTAPPTVATIRKRFEAKGEASVVLKSCNGEDRSVRGAEVEQLVLTSDAHVDFNDLPNVQILKGTVSDVATKPKKP
jgi:hypothetical protein